MYLSLNTVGFQDCCWSLMSICVGPIPFSDTACLLPTSPPFLTGPIAVCIVLLMAPYSYLSLSFACDFNVLVWCDFWAVDLKPHFTRFSKFENKLSVNKATAPTDAQEQKYTSFTAHREPQLRLSTVLIHKRWQIGQLIQTKRLLYHLASMSMNKC